MIRITRNSPSDVMRRAYRIYIDGVYRGKIKRKETKEFEVENGSYEIRAKIDWCGSNTLRVDVNDSIVDVEVGNSFIVGEGQTFVNLAHITISKDEALWLRLKVDDADDAKEDE